MAEGGDGGPGPHPGPAEHQQEAARHQRYPDTQGNPETYASTIFYLVREAAFYRVAVIEFF